MPIQRNLDEERKGINLFRERNNGDDPTTARHWAMVHKFAYPTGLPEEFASEITRFPGVFGEAGGNGMPFNPSAGASELSPLLSSLGSDREAARETYGASAARAQAGARGMMPKNQAKLQEAIRAKIGTKKMGIGGSEMFKAAGITGYGALSGSLKARGTEIKGKLKDYQNFLKTNLGEMNIRNQQLLDQAKLDMQQYEMIDKEYTQIFDRITQLEDETRGLDMQKNLYEYKLQMDAKYKPPSGGGGSSKADIEGYKAGLLEDKKAGMTLEEALDAYGASLNLDYIRDIYAGAGTDYRANQIANDWLKKVQDQPEVYYQEGNEIYKRTPDSERKWWKADEKELVYEFKE